MVKCIGCGQEINPLRLKAVPDTKTCVNCSSETRVAGFPVISGKTTYSELQIVKQETAEELYQKQDRKGSSISEGMKFPPDPFPKKATWNNPGKSALDDRLS